MAKIIEGIGMIIGMGVAAFLDPALIPFLISIEPEVLGLGASLILMGIAEQFASGATNSVSVREAAGSRQVVYGQTRITGTVVYWASTNNNSQLDQVCVWASHTLQSIDNLYLDNRKAYWTGGNGNDPTVYGTASLLDSSDHYDDAGNKYNFKGKAGCSTFLGASTGWWFSDLGSRTEGQGAYWDNTCTLNGLAATYCHAEYDSSIFNSPPNLQADVHGKNDIYDPRTGTRGWTNNAALIVNDYLCNSDFGFGCNYAVEIDEDQLIAAANICDEQVPLALVPGAWTADYEYAVGQAIYDPSGRLQTVQGYTTLSSVPTSGGSQPTWATVEGSTTADNHIIWVAGTVGQGLIESRYTINGSFRYSNNRGDTLDSMLTSMEGRISVSGGVVKIYPAAWYGTSLEFDEGDLIGPVKWTPKRKFRDLFNTVRATYVCPTYPYMIVGLMSNGYRDPNVFSGEYQQTDAPEYAQDALHGYTTDPNLAQDGGNKLYMDRRYQFVQSCATVQRLMKIYLMRNRYQGTGTLQMNLAAYQTQACEPIQMSFPLLGWDCKNLEITNFRFVPKIQYNEKSNEAPTLACELDVAETDPSIYSWSPAEERGMENTNSPFMADSFQVGAPTNLTLTSSRDTAIIGIDGVAIPRMLAVWTEPDDPFVTTGGSIVIQKQLVGNPWRTVATVAGTDTRCYIDSVVCGQQYNVSITAVRASGAYSATLMAGPHTVSDTYSSINSNGILSNIPNNTTNNCTLDSVSAGSSITVRLYGPGGVGTPGTVFQGSDITYAVGPCSWVGMLPSTGYYCYYNPENSQYYLVTDMTTAVEDFYIPLGSLFTCTLAGTGGTVGGGAAGGIGSPLPTYTGTNDSGSSSTGDAGGDAGGGDASGDSGGDAGGDAGGEGGGGE